MVFDMFSKARILVIGDIMIDHYFYGTVERMSPEAPVPILELDKEARFLGGAGIVASNLKSLGTDVCIISVVGDDESSKLVNSILAKDKIKSDCSTEKGRKTTVKKRYIATSPYFQMLLRMDNETRERIKTETEEQVIEKLRNSAAKYDFIIISDYDKGLVTPRIIESIMELAHKGKRVIVDSKKKLSDYKGAYLLVPNFKEICLAFGMKANNDDEVVRANATNLYNTLGSIVVVKRSERGATIVDSKGTRTYPTMAKDIVNVSGAGDIFVAILAAGLGSGKSLDESVMLANHGCAKAISKEHPSVSIQDFDSKD